MKKYLLLLVILFSGGAHASTPVERLLLINDFETWLGGGKSLINWESFSERDVLNFPDIKQPAHIYRDFKSNSIVAEDKYKKSFQRFYGHVSSIERDNRGEPLLVFDVAYVNKIYINGLTKNEVVRLRVPDRVDLLCIGFRMYAFDDIGATCSMFEVAKRMIAVNQIQLLDKQNKLNPPYKDRVALNKTVGIISKKIDPTFNQECDVIDSINFSKCSALLNEATSELGVNALNGI